MKMSTKEIVVDAVSKSNFGIKSKDEGWCNLNGALSDDFKEAAKSVLNRLGKGDKIEMTADFQLKKYNVIKILKKSEKKESGWQEDMVKYEDLLNDAHNNCGLKDIKTEKIEIDLKEKYALFKATVTGKAGTFQAHGDALKDNIGTDHVKPHWIRMAETRSIVRALRLLTNNTKCAEEETKKGEDGLEGDKKK